MKLHVGFTSLSTTSQVAACRVGNLTNVEDQGTGEMFQSFMSHCTSHGSCIYDGNDGGTNGVPQVVLDIYTTYMCDGLGSVTSDTARSRTEDCKGHW